MNPELYRSAVFVDGLGLTILFAGLMLADGIPVQPALVGLGTLIVVIFSTFLFAWECYFPRRQN